MLYRHGGSRGRNAGFGLRQNRPPRWPRASLSFAASKSELLQKKMTGSDQDHSTIFNFFTPSVRKADTQPLALSGSIEECVKLSVSDYPAADLA